MTPFTPFAALAGGVLIGLAAVLLMWLDGRIAGVSGIAGGLWFSVAGERAWRLLFVAGLILGAWGAPALGVPHPAPRSGFPPVLLVLAGLLVGYGTSLGSGCTSGHGVCGIARLSRRSFVATSVFLATTFVTTFVVRHVLQAVPA
jgi:uncharacterized membrane protein YedE/YeeE